MSNNLSSVRRFALIATIVAIMPAIARADFGNRVLQLAGGTLTQGTQNFFSSGINSSGNNVILDVNVDFAVWGPGTFPYSFNNIFNVPQPTIPATNYIYAYQIYNNGPLNSTNYTVFTELAVSVFGTIAAFGQNAAIDPAGVDISATTFTSFIGAGGVTYSFLTPRILPGRFSTVLLMASAMPPTMSNATVKDGGLSQTGQLPSPVPAPGAMLLGAMGLAMIRWVRRVA